MRSRKVDLYALPLKTRNLAGQHGLIIATFAHPAPVFSSRISKGEPSLLLPKESIKVSIMDVVRVSQRQAARGLVCLPESILFHLY
jgi:hypothetical protein